MKVVKAKSAILQGARAYAYARDLDFTFVYLTISPGHGHVDFLTFKIEVQSLFPATVCS